MSIMVNSAKTPSGKARKGQVTVRPDSGSIKACFPRSYFADGKQVKLGTQINPDNWEAKASQLQRRLQIELEDGKLSDNGVFNIGRYREVLREYGLDPQLRIVKDAVTSDDQLPPKPELSILEVWDMYCEYRKHDLAETTYELTYKQYYQNFIISAIKVVQEDAIKIRNWLVENRNAATAKKVIAALEDAYKLAIRQKLVSINIFEGLSKEMSSKKGAKGYNISEVENNEDDDLLNQEKAYTWNEVEIILEFYRTNKSHWYNFAKFKFLTGVRTGEAIALMWCDVLWDKEEIIIRRTYSDRIRKFKKTKNETIRRFPMPRDGELWNLLKSIPQGEPNEVVFKSKTGKIINSKTFMYTWKGRDDASKVKGAIPELIKQGKLTKYLSPYNTRHTFITHQIFDLGRDEKIVNAWCEHSEAISKKHYQDIADRAMQINPELPANQQTKQQSEIDLLKEQLKQQQELINKLLQEKNK